MTRLLPALLSLLAVGAAPPPVFVDAEGEPLPEQAVARFGSLRLRSSHPAALHPDGRRVAVFEDDGLLVRDAVTGNRLGPSLRLPPSPTGPFRPILLRYDRHGRLYACSADACHVLDERGGWRSMRCPGEPVALSPQGTHLASRTASGSVVVTETRTGWFYLSLAPAKPGVPSAPIAVAFSPDGKTIAEDDGDAVRTWDLATGRPRATYHKPPAVGRDRQNLPGVVYIDGGGRVLVRRSADWVVLDAAGLREIPGLRAKSLRATDDPVWCEATRSVLSADGHNLRRHDLADGTAAEVRTYETAVHVAAAESGVVLLRGESRYLPADSKTGRPLHPAFGEQSQVRAMRVASSGEVRLYLRSGRVAVWDPLTSRVVRTERIPPTADDAYARIDAADPLELFFGVEELEHYHGVRSARTREVLWREPIYFGFGASFDPGGRFLAMTGKPGRVVDARTGKTCVRLPECEDVRPVWSPDGRLVCLPSQCERRPVPGVVDLGLYERHTGSVRHRFRDRFTPSPREVIRDAAISGDGSTLVVSGWDGTVRVRRLDGGAGVREWAEAFGERRIAVSHDGGLIATLDDNGVRVRDATGKQVAWFKTDVNVLTQAAFLPDGRHVLTTDGGDMVLMWRIPVETPPPAPELSASWEALRGEPAEARAGVGELTRSGAKAVAFLKSRITAGDEPRCLRALEVLERVGGVDAVEQLRRLARAGSGRLAEEAREALDRMERDEGE